MEDGVASNGPRRPPLALATLAAVALAVVAALALRGTEVAGAAADGLRGLPARHAGTPAGPGPSLARLVSLGLPLYCGGRRGRLVALTFDDGPGPYTPIAVSILLAARARATFFLVGRNLVRDASQARRELQVGVLGDHTWSHPDLLGLSRAQIRAELATTQRAIERLTGQPVRLFRPPYGRHDARTAAVARGLGMLEVLWSVDSGDSRGADWQRIGREVAGSVRPGSIVLMHENRPETTRALQYLVLPLLARRGLIPVSLPELLARDPPSTAQLRAGEAGCAG